MSDLPMSREQISHLAQGAQALEDIEAGTMWPPIKTFNRLCDTALAAHDIQKERDDLKAENERLREALEPFASFSAEFVDQEGWTGPMSKARIVDWFGPSDFRAASTALKGEG